MENSNKRPVLFWLILPLIFCGMSYQLYTLIEKYVHYEYDEITIYEYITPAFPDVTVCNMDALYSERSRKGKYKEEISRFKKLGNIWDDLNAQAAAEGYREIPWAQIETSAGKLSNLPLEVSKYVGFSFNDLIVSCTYGRNDKQCTEADAMLYVDPDMYNCYTLRLNETEMQKSGPRHGLTLILYIGDQMNRGNRDKPFRLDSREAGTRGWKLMVHERNTVPSTGESTDIMPAISTSIALKPTHISRLSHPYGNCVQKINVPNTNYKGTIQTCKSACQEEIVEEKCQCVSTRLVHNHTDLFGKYCSFYNESNQMQLFKTYNCELKVRERLEDDSDTLSEVSCQGRCKNRCEETEYNLLTSFSVFPTREAMAWFFTKYLYNNPERDRLMAWDYFLNNVKDSNRTPDDYKYSSQANAEGYSVIPNEVAEWIWYSFSRVNVFFKDSRTQKRQQNPSVSLGQLCADIGGTIGLWCGFSILTIVEFLTKFKKFIPKNTLQEVQ